MSQGSSISSSPICGEPAPQAQGEGTTSATPRRAPPPAIEPIDPLVRQLREMYGAIAEEPIPEALAALIARLRGH